MKKKLFSVLLVMVIILSGCGSKIDYTDPQIYMDLISDKVNELDSTYFDNMNEVLKVTETTDEAKDLVESYKGIIGSVLNKIPKGAENFYNGFSKAIQDYSGDITESSQELKSFADKYSESGESIQKIYDKSLSITFNALTKVFDKISEFIDNATADDIKAIKNFDDLLDKYEEESGTTIEEQIKGQLKK